MKKENIFILTAQAVKGINIILRHLAMHMRMREEYFMELHKKIVVFSMISLFCMTAGTGCGYQKDTGSLSAENDMFVENSCISENEEENKNRNYFQISDRYDDGDNISFEQFKQQKDSYKKLYSFFQDLEKENLCFGFYDQFFEYIGYWDKGISYIENEDESLLNAKVMENGTTEYYSTMKTINIGKELCNQLRELNIVEGHTFTEEDFEYRNDHKIPIILGAKYQDIYEIGSTIKMYFISDEFDCEVVGFFKPGSEFDNNGYILDLDYYICMPLFNVSNLQTCDLSHKFLFSYYLEKCYCYIPYDSENEKEVKIEKVRELSEKNGIVFDANEAKYNHFVFCGPK